MSFLLQDVPVITEPASGDRLFQTIAAVVFMVAACVLLFSTLRFSILKSKSAIEDQLKRQQAQADFWRTMENVVERLATSLDTLENRIEAKQEAMGKLCKEAEAALAKLEISVEDAESQVRATLQPVANALKRKRQETGNVVDMKSATAALVRRTHRKVYESFDIGHTIQDISRETGLQIGEIELILALRDRIEEARQQMPRSGQA